MNAFTDAINFSLSHEVPWPRDPYAVPAAGQVPFGVHHTDPAPWNVLRGPLHLRGGVSGVILQHGNEIAAWGEPDRADQTFSVAKTYLAFYHNNQQGSTAHWVRNSVLVEEWGINNGDVQG